MIGNRAIRSGLLTCLICGRLCREPTARFGRHGQCPRCHATLHSRKPGSMQRTWAFLLAAVALLLPANLYPVMTVETLRGANSSTILEGVRQLMEGGQYVLAAVVLIASVVVPCVKILGLLFLLLSVHGRWEWRPKDRVRLYRILELIGRWSMLDIFVIAILIALVKVDPLASVTPNGGAVAFGVVVVMTMLATRNFDPRLIFDALEKNE
ncbi:MAG: paraquat-inducible protein A [Planctomycetota bacterium]